MRYIEKLHAQIAEEWHILCINHLRYRKQDGIVFQRL